MCLVVKRRGTRSLELYLYMLVYIYIYFVACASYPYFVINVVFAFCPKRDQIQ